MLVQSWLITINQVQQTCIVWVRRQRSRCPLRIARGAGSIDAGIGKDVQLVIDALVSIACDTAAVTEIDLRGLC